MEGESAVRNTVEDKALSAVQRRAEIRRRKLLMTSDQRINRILNYNQHQPETSETRRVTEPKLHLDLNRAECAPSSKLPSPFVSEGRSEGAGGVGVVGGVTGGVLDERRGDDEHRGIRIRPRGETSSEERSPRRGTNTYLSRFDDAIKLRSQMANEKVAQEAGGDGEEFDAFRVFRLVGSVVLAVCVRLFICHYLSIFAPFLTLELAYMGLYKYFPKVERKMKTTVLSAALLLSGIPAEVISRSAETYRRMGDVFSDLCVYFFTFITCHELLLLFTPESESSPNATLT